MSEAWQKPKRKARLTELPMVEEIMASQVDMRWHWLKLEEKYRRMLFWDCPERQKEQIFFECLANAGRVYYAVWNDCPCALAWLHTPSLKSQCAWLHFSFCRSLPQIGMHYYCATRLLALLREHYLSLLCYIPAPFLHLKKILRFCQFQQIAFLPQACWLADHQRYVHGEIWQLIFN